MFCPEDNKEHIIAIFVYKVSQKCRKRVCSILPKIMKLLRLGFVRQNIACFWKYRVLVNGQFYATTTTRRQTKPQLTSPEDKYWRQSLRKHQKSRVHWIPVSQIRPKPDFGNCGLQMQCGCIKSDQTKLWTHIGIANLPIAEAHQQTKCGKCTVINVTVIIQRFWFQSKFKRRLMYFKKFSISAPQPLWGQWNPAKSGNLDGNLAELADAGPAEARIRCISIKDISPKTTQT